MKLKTKITSKLAAWDKILDARFASVSFPGFHKKSIYDVWKFFFKGLFQEDLTLRASSLAFNFFIAIFPAVIFLFTLIAYIPIDNLDVNITDTLEKFLPEGAFVFVQETINDILTNQNAGLLSFGFVAALYFSSNGFASMLSAFDVGVDRRLQRNWFDIRLKSSMLMILVVLLLIATITINIGVGQLVKTWRESTQVNADTIATLLTIVEYLLTLGMVYFTFSSIYYFGSARGTKWRFFSAGSSFATILCLITTYGFTQYVENFNSYNKLYGSVGTLLVLMFLIYFNSFVVLLGFELNKSIDKAS